MCGTPLPFAPLTTPGAQSTLNFTRVPVEAGAPSRERSATASSRNLAQQADGDGITSSTMTASTAVEESVDAVEPMDAVEPVDAGEPTSAVPVEHDSVSAAEPPAHELVPDVPFDEYVQNFHYEPPSEPTEITMRGDASVAREHIAAEQAVFANSVASDTSQQDVLSAPAPELSSASPEPSDSSVESRLGLEPESPAEAAAERPRFLDINEAPAETQPAASGTSTIVGPSFLGLSDAPQIDGDYAAVEDFEEPSPRRSHWRAWLAAAVVLIFVGLGWMEWRAQSNQTDNGPVEVIKAKVRDMKNGGQSKLADQPATNTEAKPDMQVQEQPKPQAQDQAATSPQGQTPGSPAPTTPAASTPGPAQTNPANVTPVAPANVQPQPNKTTPQTATTTPSPTPAGKNAAAASKSAPNSSATNSTKSQTAAQAAATKAKAERQDQGSTDDTAAAKSAGSGADELNKAKNASDSVAEAAWLWKSTAKGNPDAPVMLADMYMKGDGVPRSCEQAVVLLKTAAAKENARARNRLASMYATGNCVQRNRVEAYRWLSSALAANPHSDWAQQNKNLIWQQMTPEEQAEAAKYR